MSIIKKALLTALCTMCVAGFALAQQPAQKAGKKGGDRVCAADAKKFCSEVRPGGGRVYKCLTDHNADLAPACRDRLAAAKARWDEFSAACKDDAGKYCKGIPAGSGRVLSCLKGREADLAPACKAEFARAQKERAVTQQ
jgi:hypothetical protein